MKNYIIVFTLILVSQNSILGQDFDAIKKDKNFKEYSTAYENLFEQSLDLKSIKSIMEDGIVNEKEYSLIPSALGFKSMKAYGEFVSTQLERGSALADRHSLFKDRNKWSNPTKSEEMKTVDDVQAYYCSLVYDSCIFNAHLLSITSHAACVGGMDWLIVTAPFCHSAVVLTFILNKEACKVAYDNCLNASEDY